jgi:hypothetical protein
MYHNFTRSIKKRFIETLRDCFNADPQYASIVENIQEKYEFKERPQQGIVLQSASVAPMSLSTNNFLGTLHSRVMMAQVDTFPGAFLEWVREDDVALQGAQEFPTAPGVYYLQIEELPAVQGCPQFQFMVDPLLRVNDEPLITFNTGSEPSAMLMQAPVLAGTLRLITDYGYELLQGEALQITAQQSLTLGGIGEHLSLGLPTGNIPVVHQVSAPESYIFATGVDDVWAFNVNSKLITVTFPAGTYTAQEVLDIVRTAADVAMVGRLELKMRVENGFLVLEASESLEFLDILTSPANDVLGVVSGYVPVSVVGVLFEPTVPVGSAFQVEVDGQSFRIELRAQEQTSREAIRLQLDDILSPLGVITTLEAAGDYELDAISGLVTFLHDFDVYTQITASYRYPEPSLGPFPIGGGGCANSSALPGVVLAFGNGLKDGDACAVVVTAELEEVAELYGGKAEASLDFDVIARDAMSRSEVVDKMTMYLFQWHRERLADEGLAIENVSMGGEAEEPYDDVADDYYYLANLSISLKADWEISIARPLYIERVTQVSYGLEAEIASDLSNQAKADLLTIEARSPSMLLKAGLDFERIR